MYAWIWRKLPGAWPVKALESVVIVGLISVVLVVLVFPWVEPKLPFSDNTVDGGGGRSVSSTSPAPAPTAAPSIVPTTVSTVPSTPGATSDVLPGD